MASAPLAPGRTSHGDRAARPGGARERHPARRAHPRRAGSLAGAPGGRSRGPGAPGNVLQLYDDRPTAYEAWDVDPFHLETVGRRPPAESCAVTQTGGAAGAGRLRVPVGRAARCASSCAWTRRPAGSSSTARSTGGSAHDAEGAVPGRRAQRLRHLPDAVRPRRAAHPLLDQPRPGPVRGARAPLRRPLRARLRRRAPDRLQVRLLDVRRRDADQPAALADRARSRRPTSAGTSSPTP